MAVTDYERRLFDTVAAGQWNGIAPRPTLAARLNAFEAYDALHELDPERYPKKRNWRRRIWGALAALRRWHWGGR